MSLPPAEVQYQMAHIHENSAPAAIATISVFGFIALVLLVARVVVRVRGVGLWLDDYLMIVGGICAFGQVLAVYELSHWGLGKHLLAVPPGNFVPIGKWTVVSYFTFPACIATIKWSILAQILRIFTKQDRIIRIGVWVLSIYTFLWMAGLYLAGGLGCQPFNSLWSATEPCELPWATTEISTILDIISDFAIVLLPQHVIWSLNMSVGQRVLVSMLLGMGVFCSVTGIVRIVVTKKTSPYDETYQTVPLIFTCLEPLVGIICGCSPVLQRGFLGTFAAARHGMLHLSNMSRSWVSELSRSSRSRSDSIDKTWRSRKQASDSGSSRQASRDIESQSDNGAATQLHYIQKQTTIDMTDDVKPAFETEQKSQDGRLRL